jgi:predicted transcriptional regulator
MKDKVKELQHIIHKGERKAKAPVAVVREETKLPQLREEDTPSLKVICEGKLLFKAPILNYFVLGDIGQNFSEMKVTLLVTEEGNTAKKSRYKIDLYEKEPCRQFCFEMANLLNASETAIMKELLQLTDLLEAYREAQVVAQQPSNKKQMPPMVPTQEQEAIEFLSRPNLMKGIDKLLEQAGVIGSARLLTYLVSASYKNRETLHLKVTGNHDNASILIRSVVSCIPPEDAIELVSISARALFHSTHGEFLNKALFLPSGLEKKSAQALKQLQEYGKVSTAVSVKDRLSNIVSSIKTVETHFSSVVYDNAGEHNRHTIVVSCDSQTNRIIEYNNNKQAGLINEEQESKAKALLQNIVRCIKPMQVINPYANHITLPVPESVKAQMGRLYNALVIEVCLFNQRQRQVDEKGRLLVQLEDMVAASEMLFSSMLMEVDELEPQVRIFYEGVKKYAKKLKDKSRFTLRELRLELGISKTYCFRYMNELIRLEYVKRTGYKNRGYHYSVIYFDDADKVREQMKSELDAQFKKLKTTKPKTFHESPDAMAAKAYDGGDLKLPPITLNEPMQGYSTPEE